jgi:hypothetical protein
VVVVGHKARRGRAYGRRIARQTGLEFDGTPISAEEAEAAIAKAAEESSAHGFPEADLKGYLRLLNFDWRQQVALVLPGLPAAQPERRAYAIEDVHAANAVRVLLTQIAPKGAICTDEDADTVEPGDPRNLVLICSPDRNRITEAVLDDPAVSSALQSKFVIRSATAGITPKEWALVFEGQLYLSRSYRQEAALRRADAHPASAYKEDIALLAKVTNPWSKDSSRPTKILIVAGARAFGTLGSGEYFQREVDSLVKKVGDSDFALLLRVRSEKGKLSAEDIQLRLSPPASV